MASDATGSGQAKRGRGRPRKSDTASSRPNHRPRGRPKKDAVTLTSPAKPKPGRPKKNTVAAASGSGTKSKRGRPKKDSTTEKPKRGRPKASKSKSAVKSDGGSKITKSTSSKSKAKAQADFIYIVTHTKEYTYSDNTNTIVGTYKDVKAANKCAVNTFKSAHSTFLDQGGELEVEGVAGFFEASASSTIGGQIGAEIDWDEHGGVKIEATDAADGDTFTVQVERQKMG